MTPAVSFLIRGLVKPSVVTESEVTQGDILAVMPIDHNWTPADRANNLLIHVDSIGIQAANKYAAPSYTEETIATAQGLRTRTVVKHKRRYILDRTNVPTALIDALRTSGEVTVDWNTFSQYLVDKG